MPESGQWAEHLLGNVAEVVGGGTPSTAKASYWGGSIPWITPGEVTRQEGRLIVETERAITDEGLAACSAKLLPQNAVLVTSRATVGAVALAGRPMATNQGFAALVAREGVLPRFLMYWVQANRNEFQSRASGSTFPEISRTKVKAIPILLPPLGIQRRIVDLIGRLDEQIEALNAERRALETYWASNVNDLDGERVLLGSLLERIDAGKSPLAEERQPGPGERAVLKVNAVERGRFNPLAVKTVHPSVRLPDALAVRRGDVLLVRANGVLSRVGQVCQVRIDPASLFLCDKTLRLVTRPDRLLPDYACHILSSTRSRQQIEALTGGSHMRNISQKAIRQIEIPLLELGQQAQIAGALTACLDLSDAIGAEGDSAVRLRERLLARLLSGKVEIAESYDALLAEVV